MPGELFYRVSVDTGAAGYDLSSDLTSLALEEAAGKPDQLTVELSDPFKVLSHALREGMAVEVDLGTATDHSLVFRGHIYRVEGDFPRDEVPTLRLLAYDRSVKMGLRKQNRCFTDLQLSAVVVKIAEAYFDRRRIEVEVRGDPRFAGNGIRQQEETDLAFLLRMAAEFGCEMFVVAEEAGDALRFIGQYRLMEQEPQVTLYHGRCGVDHRLLRFEASADTGDIQVPRVFSGIDYDTGERLEPETREVEEVGEIDDPFLDENLSEFRARFPERAAQIQGLLAAAKGLQAEVRSELGPGEHRVAPGFAKAADLKARSQNQFSTSIHGMRASGAAVGNHRLHAQANVRIADVGGRFSGKWYLSQVRHILDARGYRTEFECQR